MPSNVRVAYSYCVYIDMYNVYSKVNVQCTPYGYRESVLCTQEKPHCQFHCQCHVCI